MVFYIARCAGQFAVALVGIVTVAFFLMRAIPGDPALYMLGDFATPEALATLRARLGLDLPVWQQYGIFLARALQGDLGMSVVTGEPALSEILASVPPSASLAVAGMAIAIAIGVPLGVIAAVRQGSAVDVAVMLIALLGISFPVFWVGITAILLLSHALGLFPALGATSEPGFWKGLHHLALPALVLGLSVAAYIARLTRSAMLEVLGPGPHPRRARHGRAGVAHRLEARAAQRPGTSACGDRRHLRMVAWQRHPGRGCVQPSRASVRPFSRRSWRATISCCRLAFWCWRLRSCCSTQCWTCSTASIDPRLRQQ
jgi:hypothetical protein